MATVTMRYWAAAKDAAGVAEQRLTADTLAAALAQAAETAHAAETAQAGTTGQAAKTAHAPTTAGADRDNAATGRAARLRAVLARSSFLIDGDPVGLRAADSIVLREGNVIEVLPPFAGG